MSDIIGCNTGKIHKGSGMLPNNVLQECHRKPRTNWIILYKITDRITCIVSWSEYEWSLSSISLLQFIESLTSWDIFSLGFPNFFIKCTVFFTENQRDKLCFFMTLRGSIVIRLSNFEFYLSYLCIFSIPYLWYDTVHCIMDTTTLFYILNDTGIRYKIGNKFKGSFGTDGNPNFTLPYIF